MRCLSFPGLLLLCAAAQAAVTLDEAVRLARAGAPELALRQMDEAQPAYAQEPETWLAWERERLFILERYKYWERLAARLASLPEGLPPGFTRPAAVQRAEALLALDRPAEARQALLPVLWAPVAPDEPALLQARELVIRSYLAEQALEAAQTAIRRYVQDYPERAEGWTLVQARLMLRAGKPLEAVALLEGRRDAEARLLGLLGRMRAGQIAPGPVMEQAVAMAVAKPTPDEQRRLAWSLAAAAAEAIGNQAARISALEHALIIPPRPARVPVLEVDAERLWEAYLALGQALGNELRLVVGDDQAWFLAASNRYDNQPIHARALFAVVAFNALQPEQRDVAHWQFAGLIADSALGGELLEALYLDSRRFTSERDIPAAVRYLLVEHVLREPDIPLASRLIAGLDEPPPKTDPVEWHLRRARVLILGGDPEGGVAALEQLRLLETPPDTDRFLQVVFDLQTLGLHEHALRFFGWLLGRDDVPREKKREILYWAGDSSRVLDRHLEAARYYLDSATLLDPVAMDPWAQTARYQAALALAEAGMYQDARRLLTGLLNAARDPARQAVLRRELQQLALRARAPREPGP